MSLSICQDEPARSRGQRSWDSSKVLDSLPFKDVSTILLEASSRMTLSQVVSLPHFRLWDAMSAIEVMDPKMDPGVAVERSRRNDRERIANDVPKMAFSGKQIIAIADQLLSTEMTWLGGNVLTQTVFSCILTHVPLSVPNFIMRAFVISTLKTVSRMREEILSAKAFEEDEFVASSGDFGLVEEIGISEVIGDLQEAEDDVLLHLKLMKGKPADLKVSVKEALLLPDGSEGIQVLEALLSRIRLRRALLSVLLHFSKRNLPSVKKALSQCLAQLPLASSTIHLGSPVQGVFDAEINKKASSDLPVRKTAEVSPKDAYTQLSSICGQLQQVVSFTPTSRLRSVLYFLDTFSSTNSSQSLLPRAFLKSIVLRNDLLFGRYSFSDVVREASSAYATDIYYTMADTFIADRCERFLTSSAEAIHLFIELFCFGRARQRRRLFKIIAHFESLQAIAETIDGEIQNYLFRKSKATVTNEPFFLSSWVYHLKLNMMVSSFKMGFELDIFSPFELSTVFWYLRHLYDMHRVQIDRMKLFWTRDHKGHPEPKSSTKAGKRSGAPRNTPTTFESVSLEMEILLHSKQLYTKAMFILSAIIMQRKLIRPPNSHFYNEEISFSHRFKCFARLGSPTPPEYAHYIADFGDIVNSDLVETLSTSLMMLDEAQRYLNHLEQLGMKEEGQTDVFADVPHMSEAIMITRKTVEAILLKRDAGVLSVYAGWEVVEEAAGGCLSSEWRWGTMFRFKAPGFPVFGIM
ncbi:Mak10 subunit, NatC N-terminal acetyltransferase-domain-containing protein [Zopfochytrium polystomum]|nr:Mak10 subunit, NatC N-terminal acetyltransferase-domain-containing protein [Zopfochytrium polystomum]